MEKFMLPHRHGEGQTEEYLREQLDRPETFQNVADTFRLLDDTSRVRIFWLLCHCEECVINISAMVDMSSPAVSHHLRQAQGKRPDCQPPGGQGSLLQGCGYGRKSAAASSY